MSEALKPAPLVRVHAAVLVETAEALREVSERTGRSIQELAGWCVDVGMLDVGNLGDYLMEDEVSP